MLPQNSVINSVIKKMIIRGNCVDPILLCFFPAKALNIEIILKNHPCIGYKKYEKTGWQTFTFSPVQWPKNSHFKAKIYNLVLIANTMPKPLDSTCIIIGLKPLWAKPS
jgi:hypothetical protein